MEEDGRVRVTFRSMTSRVFRSSSFCNGFSASGRDPPGLDPVDEPASSSDFFSVSVDCHRWNRAGVGCLKLEDFNTRESSVLEAAEEKEEGVERKRTWEVNLRVCGNSALRNMIQG